MLSFVISLLLAFFCFMSNPRYWITLWKRLFKMPILMSKNIFEPGDMTYKYVDDSQGGSYSYRMIERVNHKSKEILLDGKSLADLMSNYFWDYKMQAWRYDEDKTRNEAIRAKTLRKRGWALLLFFIAGSAWGCPPSEDYFGVWKAEGIKGALVFNKDYTCDLVMGDNHISGNWGFDEVLCDLVITKDGKGNIYKTFTFDDGGVKDGKLLHRLGMQWIGIKWDYEHPDPTLPRHKYEPPVYRKVRS